MKKPARSSLPPEIRLPSGVQVRRWQRGDRDTVTATVNANRDYLRDWMPWAAQPATTESTDAFLDDSIAGYEADSEFAYGVFAPNGELLGAGGVHRREPHDVLEIGYWIAESQSGKGLGREVARALTVAAANAPGIVRIEIRCDEANARSAAIPRRLGYDLIERCERPREAAAHTGHGMIWSIGADRARTL